MEAVEIYIGDDVGALFRTNVIHSVGVRRRICILKNVYEFNMYFWILIFFYFLLQGPSPSAGPIKFTIPETLERIKEEFNFLQAQYHT